jgi:hypothetical protein
MSRRAKKQILIPELGLGEAISYLYAALDYKRDFAPEDVNPVTMTKRTFRYFFLARVFAIRIPNTFEICGSLKGHDFVRALDKYATLFKAES